MRERLRPMKTLPGHLWYALRRLLVLAVVLSIVSVPHVWAVTLQYVHPGTPLTFCGTGCTYAWTLQNLASAAARISAQADLGAAAHSAHYELRCMFNATSAPAVNTSAEVYLSTSDGTYEDGTVGTADAGFAADKRLNLKFIGTVMADVNSDVNFISSWQVYLPQRYVSVGVYNGFGVALDNTGAAAPGRCILTPMPPEMQ